MKKMNMKWLTAIALAFTMTSTIPCAMAYFTDTATAEGNRVINLGVPWQPNETVDKDNTKHISVTNTGNVPIYVRVFVVGDSTLIDGVNVQIDPKVKDAWFKDQDYWYYKEPLEAGETTSELIAKVTVKDSSLKEFNIVVSEEATLVIHDVNDPNNAPYPNNSKYKCWNMETDFETEYKGGN